MRFSFLHIFLLVIPFWTLVSCVEAKVTTVERQKIAVTLVPGQHLLHGRSVITLAGDGGRITFDLAPTAAIDRVTVAHKPVPFTFTSGTLAVEVPDGSRETVVTVEYDVIFNDSAPQHSASEEDPTYGVAGTITDRGTFLGSNAAWYPIPPNPPKQRVVKVTAPAGVDAVTAGRRVARETGDTFWRTTWEEEHPVENLSLSAGPYRVKESRAEGIDFYTYFYEKNARLSSQYLAAASKYLHFYVELLGPYPFKKFAVVENFFPTGYGFASYTLLGSSVIPLPFILDTSLPHEIAHNWWGNGVLVDYQGGNWCEGLVTYLADYLLKEEISSADAREYRLQILADYASLVTPDRDFPLREFRGRVDPSSRAIGYGKGAMLFHMVRSMIGDQAFFEGLREVSREKMFRKATWQDFARAFSRTAGTEVSPFMEQWLRRSGGPQFALANVASRRDGGGWEVSGTVVQKSTAYDVDLPLRLETAGGPLRQTLKVTGRTTPFRFAVAAAPRRVLLDPDAEIFRLISPDQLPPTVNMVKGSEKLTVVITKNCRAREDTMRLLLKSLGQQTARIVAEESLQNSELRRDDLLFCGVPQHREVLSSLPEGTVVSTRGFTIGGTRFEDDRDVLFLATRNPLAAGVVALFLPLSEKAAEQAVLKLTHYGKYGYLVFTDGKNTHKGTIKVAGGDESVNLMEDSRK